MRINKFAVTNLVQPFSFPLLIEFSGNYGDGRIIVFKIFIIESIYYYMVLYSKYFT